MAAKRQDFAVSRILYALVEVIGWLIIFGAVGVGVIAAQFQPLPMALSIGIGGCVTGLLTVLGAQMSRAIIVTAENSYELVELARTAAIRTAKPEASNTTPALNARR